MSGNFLKRTMASETVNRNARTNLDIYQNFAEQYINKTGAWDRAKYWTMFFGLTFAGSAASEFIFQNMMNAQGFGLTFLGVTLGTAMFQYVLLRLSSSRIAESMGGQRVSGQESKHAAWLVKTVAELSKSAGLSAVPRCYIVPTGEKNAFAAGFRAEDSIVAVTTGILETLDPEELRAVLAHEIGHVRNGDSRTALHLIAMNAGFFAVLRLALNLVQSRRRGDEKNDKNTLAPKVILLAIGAALSLLGVLFRAMISRRREYEADACSIAFTHNHKPLQSALRKISVNTKQPMARVLERGRDRESVLSNPSNSLMYSHMYINMPDMSPLLSLFSSHPPIEKRIARLEELNRKLHGQ